MQDLRSHTKARGQNPKAVESIQQTLTEQLLCIKTGDTEGCTEDTEGSKSDATLALVDFMI